MSNETESWIENDSSAFKARLFFLILFVSSGIVSNVVLLIAIVRSRKRRFTFSVTIINVCLVNLLQCILVGPYVIGTSVCEKWMFGESMCTVVSFIHIDLICTKTLCWLLLSVERFAATTNGRYVKCTILNQRRFVTTSAGVWAYCIVFCFPIFLKVIYSKVNTTKYVCTLDSSNSLIYTTIICLFCFLLPFLSTLSIFVVLCKKRIKEQAKVHNITNEKKVTSNTLSSHHEFCLVIYSLILFILWVIIELPLLVLILLQQFYASYRVENQISMSYFTPGTIDTVFMWMAFSYSTIYACFILTFVKFIKHGLRNYGKQKSKPEINTSISLNNSREKVSQQDRTSSLVSLESYSVPVLFATSRGIHLKTYKTDRETSRTSLNTPTISLSKLVLDKSNSLQKCDVLDYKDFLQYSDTSDYDSSEDSDDPCSASHPVACISQRHSVVIHKRCNSEPEVDIIQGKIPKHQILRKSRSNLSHADDSGIDLRHGTDNSLSFSTISQASKKSFSVAKDL